MKKSNLFETLFLDPNIERFTNEYALKEVYHTLKNIYHFSETEIGYALDYVREKCIILPTPKKEEFMPITIRDKSDKPIVFSAYKYGLILYTCDYKTAQDAKKYAQVKWIEQD